MIRNYFTIAYRNILRHKGYALINIVGLAVGIASCLLIALYIKDEVSYDRYHKNLNQIYRVVHAYQHSPEGEPLPPLTPSDFQVWGNAPVGAAMLADFPEVQKVVQFTGRQSLLFQFGEKRYQEKDIFFADSTVFDVFTWQLLEGNPTKALTAPNSIVLTKSLVKKYFGDTNPVGQQMIIDNGESYNVTGVMEDVPKNSHFVFDALISMTTFRKHRAEIFDWWGYVDFYTYFLVPENFDQKAMQAKVPAFLKKHGNEPNYQIAFEALPDAYLHSEATRQPGATGNLTNLYIFGTVAAFILLIACINFMNLATARAMDRAKEVGVRKVVGARQRGLIVQFLTEATLLSMIASVLALGIAGMALPAFENISGKIISLDELQSPSVILALVVVAIVTGLLSGSYPALVLSNFKPALVLKGLFRSSSHGASLRKGLVVFQFSLSVILIVGTIVVFNQLNHMRDRELGFTNEQMMVIDFGWDEKVQHDIEIIKNTLRNVPSVISVSAQRTVPGGFFPKAGTDLEMMDGKTQHVAPDLFEIDFDFIHNLGIKMAAGRNYSRAFPSDSTHALVINEAAAKAFGYPTPEAAIGKKFSQWGSEGVIIGVVKDFNYRSLHNKVEPLTLRLQPQWATSSVCLRLNSQSLPATIKQIEARWHELAPHRPFLYSFLDDDFNAQYKKDHQFGQVFGVFASLAIFIACFGLFGLTTYATQQRTKEIGIRKVLGASVFSIVALLSKDFMKLVFASIIVGAPVAAYFMQSWLNKFAYHTTINAGTFIISGISVIAIALSVVCWQSVRTALSNPVKSLRNE